MRALITLTLIGLPLAIALAWYFELTSPGIERDGGADAAPHSAVRGVRRYADITIIGVHALPMAFLLLRDSDWLAGSRSDPSAALN